MIQLKEFTEIERANKFLEETKVVPILISQTLMVEPTSYGNNSWIQTVIAYEETKKENT